MWTRNARALCEALEIAVPIVQGPMAGGPTTPAMVAAVSNAGGLGSLGAGYLKPDALRDQIAEIQARTSQPFAVNVFVPPPDPPATALSDGASAELAQIAVELGLGELALDLDAPALFEEQCEAIVDAGVPVVSFTFGLLPAAQAEALARRGVKAIGTATCVEEARRIERAGCAAVVAQGFEAGGHRGSFGNPADPPLVGTMALVPQVADAVAIPVLAAGGIMDGRGIAAALMLGAGGAQMGTAFLVAAEAGTDAVWRERVLASSDVATALTRGFSGKPARGIENEFMRRMSRFERELPDYPVQNQVTTRLRAAAKQAGRAEYMSLWAGQGAPLARAMPAGELVATLCDEVEALLPRAPAVDGG